MAGFNANFACISEARVIHLSISMLASHEPLQISRCHLGTLCGEKYCYLVSTSAVTVVLKPRTKIKYVLHL